MKNRFLRSILLIIFSAFIAFTAIVGFGNGHAGSYKGIRLGLDLAGGVSITYQAVKEDPTSSEMEDARYKLMKRAEDKSTESAVYIEGDNRINVDIPNVTDAEKVLEEMGSVGSIYFVLAQGEDGVANFEKDPVTGEYSVLTRSMDEIIAAGNLVLDGSHISNAQEEQDPNSISPEYVVELTFTPEGMQRFTAATEQAAKYYTPYGLDLRNVIAIVYDGEVVCFPRVNTAIKSDTAVIEGQSSLEEAKELATTIRIGALPIELEEIRSQVVGARLGSEALRTSLMAGLIGFIVLGLFMIIRYRVPGVAAFLALCIYVLMMIVGLNICEVTLTLPGIAGIILSIGMAVDANVVIFARIREEMAGGKTVRSAVNSGFKKARSAIIDGNVTTLIAALVLYLRGSGTVKGFAITLGIGIVLSMVSAMFITKSILLLMVDFGIKSEKAIGTLRERKKFDFVGNFRKVVFIPAVVVLVGVVFIFINNGKYGSLFNYSLDFVGGTSTEVHFNGTLPENVQLEMEELTRNAINKNAEISLVEETNSVLIKTTDQTTDERLAMLDALAAKYGINPEQVETETISSIISGEMRSDAIWATVIAVICMLVYILIRFKNLSYAFSSVIALVHDVLMVVLTYVFAARFLTVGGTFIACILTILGYSINDTIVIFDRIREEMKEREKDTPMEEVVNNCISETLSRSVDTSVTTLFMVIALAILGVASIREFAIPLIVGIVAGCFSSVMISAPLWLKLEAARAGRKANAEPEEETP